MKCTAALAGVLALAMLLTGCKKPVDTAAATAETAESAATDETAATPNPVEALPASVTVGTVLPKTEAAGRSYIDETLFIGDSNTARYLMYADETGTAFTTLANNIGVVSMGAGAITTLKCEQFSGSSTMYTVPDAVAMLKPKRIIICYGTNNLGGSSTDATSFISTYLKGLKAIETAWPYCDIIVSAIPPLDKQRENTNLTMTQVDAYNAALIQMCEENGYKFLNSAEVLRDDATGWAKTDYTLSDGVHLSKTAVTEYFTYVRTHAYVTEDRRPQPLGNIPTPVGPPVNLISQDPIAVRGAKVPLEFVATNGGKISGSASQLVKKGATASAVTAVPDDGFVFAGWTSSTGGKVQQRDLQHVVGKDLVGLQGQRGLFGARVLHPAVAAHQVAAQIPVILIGGICQQFFGVFHRHGLEEVVALRVQAVCGLQHGHLFRGLHALGDDGQVQPVRHIHHLVFHSFIIPSFSSLQSQTNTCFRTIQGTIH